MWRSCSACISYVAFCFTSFTFSTVSAPFNSLINSSLLVWDLIFWISCNAWFLASSNCFALMLSVFNVFNSANVLADY
ncbi:hypothetical protein NW739_00235 [Mycoplasmopsis felis]|uniref:hypothetical protein n=1 Tax=Mycoplasmopsis felis TaxID=33923 RepID=UPI0021E00473|nr:hypothetical protein [Mycoplasmopsis felis]MCU9939277.1 hypothetical protein [Mycoplasmopsis felis]